MTTVADWSRAILDAAEERGYAVIAIDVRASAVTQEATGSGSIVLRISGRTLDAHFISQLPQGGTWQRDQDPDAGPT
jgi:hypothetical protein